MNNPPVIKSFVYTDEYFRFSEFCDACKANRYIGLCYGPPGVGKTISARRYTNSDEIEKFDPYESGIRSLEETLWKFDDLSRGAMYTPSVTNTPNQVEAGIQAARRRIYNLREERVRRQHEPIIEVLRERLSRAVRTPDETDDNYEEVSRDFHAALDAYRSARRSIPKPQTSLVIIDESDRLKVASMEMVRDVFDRSNVGIVLIGMPGMEKRLARYPQLYSRIGFVHEFRPLTKKQVVAVLSGTWRPEGVDLPVNVFDDESIAAVIRVTGGNFRLLHRLLTQINRIMEINKLDRATVQVVDAARESLVIGIE